MSQEAEFVEKILGGKMKVAEVSQLMQVNELVVIEWVRDVINRKIKADFKSDLDASNKALTGRFDQQLSALQGRLESMGKDISISNDNWNKLEGSWKQLDKSVRDYMENGRKNSRNRSIRSAILAAAGLVVSFGAAWFAYGIQSDQKKFEQHQRAIETLYHIGDSWEATLDTGTRLRANRVNSLLKKWMVDSSSASKVENKEEAARREDEATLRENINKGRQDIKSEYKFDWSKHPKAFRVLRILIDEEVANKPGEIESSPEIMELISPDVALENSQYPLIGSEKEKRATVVARQLRAVSEYRTAVVRILNLMEEVTAVSLNAQHLEEQKDIAKSIEFFYGVTIHDRTERLMPFIDVYYGIHYKPKAEMKDDQPSWIILIHPEVYNKPEP